MEERQSRLSNMDWKRFRPYLCVRLIPQNSMFSNFCHLLNPHNLKSDFFRSLGGQQECVFCCRIYEGEVTEDDLADAILF